MAFEVKVPGVGESVQEGMIAEWMKETGDYVNQDDVLCELETDKATVEVVAETAGQLELLASKGKVVSVGEVIAKIDESAKDTAEGLGPQEATEEKGQTSFVSVAPKLEHGPAVRRIAAEQGLDTKNLTGSGRSGRAVKADLLGSRATASPPSNAKEAKDLSLPPIPDPPASSADRGERASTREPMSMLRRRIAERLVESQRTAAILTTFNEVDMGAIIEARKSYREIFEKKHGVKLGFMGFFLKASVQALQEFPLVNASLEGEEIVYHHYCDIGVAVSTAKGLLVPVVRNVEGLSLAGIEKAIVNYSNKARENKIGLDDLSGGTFTVSNGGIFGSLISTPIINPPQTAILGMHKIQQRPMVLEDGSIEARPMMYLALSYDHRLIDGKEAVQFLVSIKNCLEDPQRLLLGV